MYLVVLRVFAAHLCIWLCCECLQSVSVFCLSCEYLRRVSVFGCIVSICREFMYLVVLRVFAGRFCIWLCCEYVHGVSVFYCFDFKVSYK